MLANQDVFSYPDIFAYIHAFWYKDQSTASGHATMSTSNTSSTGDAIVKFFEQTCSSREACHAQAKEIVGGEFEPVEIQGSRSYTGYAGEQRRDTIVQFRLEHSNYDIETARLARRIYERLVPGWYSYGVVDSSMNMKKHDEGKELLNTYVMNRLEGIPYLKSVLVQFPENSEECFTWRKNIMTGLGEYGSRYLPRFLRIFANTSWIDSWPAPIRGRKVRQTFQQDILYQIYPNVVKI